MKKFAIVALGVMIASAGFASTASAATANGDSVHNFAQGLKKNGAAVDVSRSDATNALGTPDSSFVSLGYGGTLDIKFSQLLGGTLSVTVSETTNGSYPEETADVYVSEDGSNWTLVGTATNDGGNQQDSVIQLDSEMCVEYVRLVDTTDSGLHNNGSDGFDVDAVAAEYTGECEIQEQQKKINVQNNNGANVQNVVMVGANTGKNNANGGNAGNGGNGGNVNNSNSNNTGGRGGDAGNGGMGGSIFTGDAIATGNVVNMVNHNVTRINGCNCGASMITVRNNNGANVGNMMGVKANSGKNNANGGNQSPKFDKPIFTIIQLPPVNGGAPSAGNGGNVNNSNNNNVGGRGGNIGNGGAGGWIQTGTADSLGSVSNTVNRNVTRIR